jgi:hypothetical protein
MTRETSLPSMDSTEAGSAPLGSYVDALVHAGSASPVTSSTATIHLQRNRITFLLCIALCI